jgi:hypothetical protein
MMRSRKRSYRFGDDEPGLHQSRIVVIGDRRAQRLPGVRRIAQPEARSRSACEASPLEVLDRGWTVLELSAVVILRLLEQVSECANLAAGVAVAFR